mgnify:CR=1 FL=1
MKIDVITLFPAMFKSVFAHSIIKRAQQSAAVEIKIHNLRDWSVDKHRMVDDRPFGGGPGMVLKVDVLHAAITALKEKNKNSKVILLSPQGKKYSQAQAEAFANQESGLILIAGHYEGFDERIRKYVDHELSIGDYVLTGGEIPAMVVVDSVVRLLPGVLGDSQSAPTDSFSNGSSSLSHPQYTRPEEFNGDQVPAVLLSGNHGEIAKWRQEKAQQKTESTGK